MTCVCLKIGLHSLPEFQGAKDVDFLWLTASRGRVSWGGTLVRDFA